MTLGVKMLYEFKRGEDDETDLETLREERW